MNGILAETLRGRHPADVNFRSPVRTKATEQDPASFFNGNPIAEIEQAHVFSSGNGSEPEEAPAETVVFQKGQGLGRRYIKHPELTNPPMT